MKTDQHNAASPQSKPAPESEVSGELGASKASATVKAARGGTMGGREIGKMILVGALGLLMLALAVALLFDSPRGLRISTLLMGVGVLLFGSVFIIAALRGW